MRETIVYIPHEVAGLPVFGFGWLLLIWAVASIGLMFWLVKRQGWSADTRSYLPLLLLLGVGIVLLPMLEVRHPRTGEIIGLPIRGYGVMLLLGIVAAVGLAARRAGQMGLDPEVIFSMAFWAVVGGIGGARLFYVIQYWPRFQAPTIGGTIANVLSFNEGGLVFYGSMLGGAAGVLLFLQLRKLPVLAMGDIIAPSLVAGLALGRIGCLFHGCCFGGICTVAPLAMTFPAINDEAVDKYSPPYLAQWQSGQLFGLELAPDAESNRYVVEEIRPGSPAADAGLEESQTIASINGYDVAADTPLDWRRFEGQIVVRTTDGGLHTWSAEDRPPRTLPVFPTQLMSAVNAALLTLLVWTIYPFRRRDGEVFAVLLTLYPITRILLEVVRTDEPGRFGTPLTISQIVSLALLLAAAGLWWYVESRPRGSALPPQAPQAI